MNSLWLFYLPFMYMPNPGIQANTGFGSLEFADFLAPILLLLILIARKSHTKKVVINILPALASFVLIALLSSLLIPLVYDEYVNSIKVMLFSLLKLAKFLLYTYIGISVPRLLVAHQDYGRYYMSLLFCGLVAATGLIIAGVIEAFFPIFATVEFYKATNLMSVAMAMLVSFLGVLYLEQFGTPKWRRYGLPILFVMLGGLFMTQGRGGWLALIISFCVYFLYRPFRGRNLVVIFLAVAVLVTMYSTFAPFRREIDNTFFRSEAYLQTYNAGVGGVDDGARLSTWAIEFPKLIDRPFLGTGFFHRGGETRLWPTGSHNFFLQILLETGIVGLVAFLFFIFKMWMQARRIRTVNPALSTAFQVTMVTFIIGAMSGEYFYGGLGLLTLFLIFAPIGSIPRSRAR